MKFNRSTLLNLVLALAILFAGLAIFPAPVFAADDASALEASPRFSARVQGNDLIIDGRGFASYRGFFVKVRTGPRKSWERLGSVAADRSGLFHAVYHLPSDMRKPYGTQLRVCIKDLRTNKSYCTWARR